MAEFEWVRVKNGLTKDEYSVAVPSDAGVKVLEDGLTVLDKKDAVDEWGKPLPPKHYISPQAKKAESKEETA